MKCLVAFLTKGKCVEAIGTIQATYRDGCDFCHMEFVTYPKERRNVDEAQFGAWKEQLGTIDLALLVCRAASSTVIAIRHAACCI